jgi:hypothetical protein
MTPCHFAQSAFEDFRGVCIRIRIRVRVHIPIRRGTRNNGFEVIILVVAHRVFCMYLCLFLYGLPCSILGYGVTGGEREW